MLSAFVIIDANQGTIRRYEVGGNVRKTHAGSAEGPATFTAELVEDFRRFPPPEFYVGPPLGPIDPNGGNGGAPAQMVA